MEISPEKMEEIQPSKVMLKSGKYLNVATAGSGPAILFLHGFPGSWYTWRHQLIALGEFGYQAIAPDLRGYGGSSTPDGWSSYSTVQIVGDLVALLEALELEKVFLVGHDLGAIVAWHFCLLRPGMVKAMVNTSVALMLRDQSVWPIPSLEDKYGHGLYVCRFQDPKKVNDEISRCDPENVVKGFYDIFSKPSPLVLPDDEGFDDLFSKYYEQPSFLNLKDVRHYADTFRGTGYIGGLSYYRAIEQTWEEMAAYEGLQITTPVNFVVGEHDFMRNFYEEYINNGGLKRDVPNVTVTVLPGVGHFLNEEEPRQLSHLINNYFEGSK